ncbi:MAG: hypothetical protein AB8F78_00185 [Saprospiraceae bacterium]
MANTPQSYIAKYRSLTPEQLAAIITSKEDHHPDAVTAARVELTARMLPAEALDRVYELAETRKKIPKSTAVELTPWQKALKKQEENNKNSKSIWWKTIGLKVVLAYLLYSLGRNIRTGISDYSSLTALNSSSLDLLFYFSPPLLLLLIIGLGIKGYKSAWWGAIGLFTFSLLITIARICNTYHYHYYISSNKDANTISELIQILTHDPKQLALNLILPVFFLYLLLRKDTRIACGITKGEAVKMDELDHLI